MAVQELTFQGINRAITDYAVTGACEELINLRPTTGGLVPVKDFTVKMQDFSYDAIYVHYAGNTTNYIAIDCGANGHVDIIHIAEDGSTISTLKTFDLSGTISSEDIHFAYTGNIILISICDKEASVYSNYSFLWRGEEYGYRETDVEPPHINASLNPGTPVFKTTTGFNISQNATRGEVTSMVKSALNSLQEKNEDLCFGSILIAIALKTNDGKTAFTSLWQIYNPTPDVRATSTPSGYANFIVDGDWAFADRFPEYFSRYSDGFHVNALNTYRYFGVPLTLYLTMDNYLTWDSDKSLFKSVEVYVSRPRLYADPEVLYGDMKYFAYAEGSSAGPHVLLPEVPPSLLELENQLLYLQKSIPIDKIVASGSTPYELPLKFGGNLQTTQDTLDVDTGLISRFGDILSYNSRFHYFNSVKKEVIRMPDFSYTEQYSGLIDTDVFVIYNDGQKDIPLYCGVKQLPDHSSVVASIVVSPSINVKSVVTQQPANSVLGTTTVYPMSASERYNYSIFIAGSSLSYRITLYDRTQIQEYVLIEEPSAINVTEQYNPAVFKPEHSYLAPGKVLDVQPQMVAVKDVTFGDYPLNVFTDRGTYALLQGNGQVLYGNFRSMSNLVSTANSAPTEHGTFFLAAGGLWAVAGSDAILISDALHLGPHKFIRDCAGYQALSASGAGYNVANYVSEVPFEEFTKCAKLSYNRFRDELIVSNNFYRYSYVLSLKYRQWFKIDECLLQDNIGVNIAKRGNRAVVVTVISSLAAHLGQIVKVNYVFDVQRESSLYTRVTVTLDLLEALTVEQIQDYLVAALSNTILSGTTVAVAVDSTNMTLATEFNLPATITGNVKGHTESLRAIPPITPDSPTTVDSTSNMSVSRTTEVIDFSEETDGSVRAHLQSRPFSFNGYMYSHIHRIVSMVRTALSTSDLLIAAIYGSDDLQNWTLLSYAGRAGSEEHNPLQISQLRTPPAARSWRYYTICIGGTVPTDTDFGPVLVDYQPVIRRLG